MCMRAKKPKLQPYLYRVDNIDELILKLLSFDVDIGMSAMS